MNTLNLDNNAPGSANSPESNANTWVDVTAQNFAKEIVEASNTQLVIANFWSPKSAASKQLTPILNAAINATEGAAKLAKINVERNAQIAQQMQVKSIPAVYAFWQGQPVDGFMGAIPEQQLTSWLTKLIHTTGAKAPHDPSKGIARAIKQAELLMEKGDLATAQAIFEDLAAEFPEEPEVIAGCLSCLVKLGKYDDATDLLKTLPKEITGDNKLQSAKAALELAQQSTKDYAPVEEWETELKNNPDSHQIRFDLAMHQYGLGNSEEALDQLLEITRRDRKWNDDGARLQVLKIFEALGPTHEHTIAARKKLSAILFS